MSTNRPGFQSRKFDAAFISITARRSHASLPVSRNTRDSVVIRSTARRVCVCSLPPLILYSTGGTESSRSHSFSRSASSFLAIGLSRTAKRMRSTSVSSNSRRGCPARKWRNGSSGVSEGGADGAPEGSCRAAVAPGRDATGACANAACPSSTCPRSVRLEIPLTSRQFDIVAGTRTAWF